MSLSKILTSRVGFAATLASIMIAGVGSASAQTTNFNQNFSADANGMNVIPGFTDLVLNTNGYGANCSTGRAEIYSYGSPAGTSTRWQGLQNTFPAQYGYVNSLRVYLDPCAVAVAPTNVAVRSTSSVSEGPNPVFNIISGLNLLNSTGIAGEAAFLFERKYTVDAEPDYELVQTGGQDTPDDTSDDTYDLEIVGTNYFTNFFWSVNVAYDDAGSFTNADGYSISPSCYGDFTICEAGWYTFATRFFTNLVGGDVTVQFIIQDESSSCALHTFCTVDTGLVATNSGGQRYGLISGSNLQKLKVDDVQSIKGRAPKAIAQTVNLTESDWGSRICLGYDVYPVGATTQFRLTTDISSYLGTTSPNVADGWFCWPKVRFCKNDDVSGTTNFSYQVTDGSTVSTAAKVTIVVTPINDPPTFSLAYNTSANPLTLNEEAVPVLHSYPAVAYQISPGPTDESAQVVYFAATALTPSLFTTQPAISTAGTLTFKLAPNASGFSIVNVVAHDNGTPNAYSTLQAFKIVANPVNTAPTITGYSSKIVSEDSTGNTFTFILTDKETTSPADFVLSYTSSNNAIIDGSAITDDSDTTGSTTVTASYTLKPDAFGSVGIAINALDAGDGGGGLTNVLNALSAAPKTNSITVLPKNDQPGFVFGPFAGNFSSTDSGVSATILSAPTAPVSLNVLGTFYPNAANHTDAFESTQKVKSFIITDSTGSSVLDATKFKTKPTMTSAGVLTYALSSTFSGTYDLKIKVMDDGGTSNSGVDTSVAHVLHLQLSP